LDEKEPKIGQYPTEIFGYSYTDHSDEASSGRRAQFCPYLQAECKKPRKSDPKTKIGSCSLGYKTGTFMQKYEPIIVCPHRMWVNSVKGSLAQTIFPDTSEALLSWHGEVPIGQIGTADYVLVKHDNKQNVEDFVVVELQTNGTTGTPWDALVDFKKYGRFTQEKYKYGLNWANQYQKTMMSQIYKKGEILRVWEKRYVIAVQDTGIMYMQHVSGNVLSEVVSIGKSDFYFVSYSMKWDGKRAWGLVRDKIYSASIEDINTMLKRTSRTDLADKQRFEETLQVKFAGAR